MLRKLLLLLGVCLLLTACANDKDSKNSDTSTTTIEDKIPTAITPTPNENEEQGEESTPGQSEDTFKQDDSESTDESNQDSSDNNSTPDDSKNEGDSATGEEPKIDYLKILEKPLPAISTVDDILLVNKSFYLEPDYVPSNPTKPNIKFSFSTDDATRYWLTYEAATAIEALFADAKSQGIELAGVSLYRSYNRQKSIYNANVERQGLETASKYSAKPGFSEHQTGLAIDVSAASVGYDLVENFASTTEGKWVNDNCHRFGFIIRFKEGKEDITGYAYEPWHLRYVGIDAATYIMENDLTLEEYYALKDK